MPRPAGVTGFVLFFTFGAVACITAGALLLHPGTPLDAVWSINPLGHQGFLRMGPWAIVLLVAVCLVCSLAAIGLREGAAWGRRVAISVLALDFIGDAAQAIVGGDARSLIGLPVAGLSIAYLVRNPGVRRYFGVRLTS